MNIVASRQSNIGNVVLRLLLIAGALSAALAVGWMSGRVPGEYLVVGALGLVLAATAFFQPRILLFLAPPAIALSPEFDVAGLPLRVEDFLIAPLALAWVMKLMVRLTDWPKSPATNPILAVIGVDIVATGLGALGGMTTLALDTPYSGTLFVLKSIEVFLLFFIAVDTLRTRREIKFFAYWLALSGTALAAQGMVQHLAAGDFNAFIPDPEGGPTYSLIALALLTAVCIAASFFVLSRSPASRMFWAAALVPLAYSLLFSFSRQAYIGVAAGLAFIAYTQVRRAMPYLALAVVLLVAFSPESAADRAATLLEPLAGTENASALTLQALHESVYGTRLRQWMLLLPEAMTSNPFFGRGAASLPPGFLDSQYLAVIYYNGLVGLGLFLWMLWRTGKSGWTVFQSAGTDTHLAAIGLALAAATIGLSISGIGGVPFVAIRARQMFWFLAALGIAAWRTLPAGDDAPVERDSHVSGRASLS